MAPSKHSSGPSDKNIAATTISLEENPDESDVQLVSRALDEFNFARAGDDNFRRLVVFARDAHGSIAGGLLGATYWGWLSIDRLWVREELRGQGLGERLLRAAEQEAVARGCRYAHVDTLDFQAPAFYMRFGYIVWGVLDDLPPGHSRYFLKKELHP